MKPLVRGLIIFPAIVILGCLSEDDGTSVEDTPPGPNPTNRVQINLEVDNLNDLINANPGQTAIDVKWLAGSWDFQILQGIVTSCATRYDLNDGDMDIRLSGGTVTSHTNDIFYDEAMSRYPLQPDETTRNVLLLSSERGSFTAPIDIYVLGAQHYKYDPTTYSYPTGPPVVTPYGIMYRQGTVCEYNSSKRPLGVVFARDIEKMAIDMGSWFTSYCGGNDPYDVSDLVSRTLYHELFHSLYIPEYGKGSNQFCHDGDNNCRCVMNNTVVWGRVYDLVINQSDCITAENIVLNQQTPCIENSHASAGCSFADLLAQGGP